MIYLILPCILFMVASVHSIPFSKVTDCIDNIHHSTKNQFSGVNISLEGKELPEWMQANILREFQGFKQFSVEDIEKTFDEYPEGLVHFRIRNGILYVRANRSFNEHPISQLILMFINILAQPRVHIENGDFLVITWDTAYKYQSKCPILCFSKHCESNYVTIPDWVSLSEDRVSLMKKIDSALAKFPWESKVEKGFWIGSPNGVLDKAEMLKFNNRALLTLFSSEYPDLVWAKFIGLKNCPWVHPSIKRLDPIISVQKHISEDDSCQYKYLIDVDGWGSSYYRTQWILRSASVLIKENSGHVQWYYSGLKPYVHYIPYQTDCSDLEKVIIWLRENDEQAKKIAVEGRNFNFKYLDRNMGYLYLYHVLKTYSQYCIY